jgi:hypothetical protein
MKFGISEYAPHNLDVGTHLRNSPCSFATRSPPRVSPTSKSTLIKLSCSSPSLYKSTEGKTSGSDRGSSSGSEWRREKDRDVARALRKVVVFELEEEDRSRNAWRKG